MLYVSGKHLSEITQNMNEDLKIVYKWLCANKLKLNLEKTIYMCLTNKRINKDEFVLKVNGVNVQRVEETKYLGIVIDEKLSFDSNIEYVSKKMSKKINFIGRIRNKLPITNRIQLYMAMVAPHIEYCSSILFLCNKSQIDRLQKLQNRGMRIVLNLNIYTSIKFMLDCLCWMSVRQRIFFNTMCFIFKINNGLLPPYLKDNIKNVSDVHNYNVRNIEQFRLPKLLKVKNQNNLYYRGLKFYNEMPENIKKLNFNAFKRECSKYIKEIIEI